MESRRRPRPRSVSRQLRFHHSQHRRCAGFRFARVEPHQREQLASGAARRRRRVRRRAKNSESAPAALRKPLFASHGRRSPSRSRASGSVGDASGETWIAAGTLPGARHAPIGDERHLDGRGPAPRRGGGQLVQLGMPCARPWNRTTTGCRGRARRPRTPRVPRSGRKTRGGASTSPALGSDRARLEHGAAEVALDEAASRRGRKGSVAGQRITSSSPYSPDSDELLAVEPRFAIRRDRSMRCRVTVSVWIRPSLRAARR